jgi:hypothetical protein
LVFCQTSSSQRSVSQTFADQKQKKKNDCNANSNKDKRESLITIQDFSAINGNKIFHEKESQAPVDSFLLYISD